MRYQADMLKSLAHWGSSKVTGRGLLALAGRGSIAQIKLESEESYIAHPSNVVAYSMNRQNPLPYRLKSSIFRLQIPDLKLSSLIPDTKFSQLFLRFHGPTTILLQTRAARLHDVLTNRDVNEIAGPPTSAVPNNSHAETNTSIAAASQQPGISSIAITKPAQLSTARIGSDGKVIFTKGGACE
ncbi:MAG: hypothetical protein LQ343_002054 [Gyalolechia ehrenbergii]|nr:MAG: hypothetical protein LQ343_002054 [Gyalolechia ehrenbergii]